MRKSEDVIFMRALLNGVHICRLWLQCVREVRYANISKTIETRNIPELMLIAGFSSTPSSSPVRIPYVIGSTLAFIVYTAYAAAITSVLAIKTIPIQSFQDLVVLEYV